MFIRSTLQKAMVNANKHCHKCVESNQSRNHYDIKDIHNFPSISQGRQMDSFLSLSPNQSVFHRQTTVKRSGTDVTNTKSDVVNATLRRESEFISFGGRIKESSMLLIKNEWSEDELYSTKETKQFIRHTSFTFPITGVCLDWHYNHLYKIFSTTTWRPTIVLADTGSHDTIAKIKPQDDTNNPTLITKAAIMQ